MPSHEELIRLKSVAFKGTEKDYSQVISMIEALGVEKEDRLFDFGCSWGYGSWQFLQSGYNVESYEISEPRRNYAIQYLGCTVYSRLADVQPGVDVFFSSHVLEHVPSPRNIIELALSILKPGGLFIALTPNGSTAHRIMNPGRWQRLWGLVHPNFLDDKYYCKCFRNFPYLLASFPYDLDKIRSWAVAKHEQRILDISGPELMFAVKLEHLRQLQEPDEDGGVLGKIVANKAKLCRV